MGTSHVCETFVFLYSVLLGVAEGIVFDAFRAVRKHIPRSFAAVGATDVLYWIFSGMLFASAVYSITGGGLRAYIFVGMLLGAVLYFLLFGRVALRVISVTFSVFLKIFQFFFKILLTPGHFFYKMVLVSLSAFFKGMSLRHRKNTVHTEIGEKE